MTTPGSTPPTTRLEPGVPAAGSALPPYEAPARRPAVGRGGGLGGGLAASRHLGGILVAVAAALAFALPGTIYAFFEEDAGSGGARATVVLLLLLTTGLSVLGTSLAAKIARGSDDVVARLTVGFGIFTATYAGLQLLAAAAR